jgi:hypothetical protein
MINFSRYLCVHAFPSPSQLVVLQLNGSIFSCLLQRSAIEQDVIVIDQDTKDMLDSINFKDLSGIQVASEGQRV